MFSLVCKRREIFAHWNLFEKSMGKQRGFFYHQNYNEKSRWKQRGFFDQRNYVERSTWEKRGFFDHRNCVEKSTLKQRGFFDNRNYFKKVCGNNVDSLISEITSKKYMEMTQKFVKIWSSMYWRNIDVESTSIQRGVPIGVVEVLNKVVFYNY